MLGRHRSVLYCMYNVNPLKVCVQTNVTWWVSTAGHPAVVLEREKELKTCQRVKNHHYTAAVQLKIADAIKLSCPDWGERVLSRSEKRIEPERWSAALSSHCGTRVVRIPVSTDGCDAGSGHRTVLGKRWQMWQNSNIVRDCDDSSGFFVIRLTRVKWYLTRLQNKVNKTTELSDLNVFVTNCCWSRWFIDNLDN